MKRLTYILLMFSQLLSSQVLTNLSGDIISSGGNIMKAQEIVEFFSTQSGAINQTTFTFKIDAGKILKVDWGNGVISSLTGTGSDQNISSTYAYSNNTYRIRIYGDLDNVKKLLLNETGLRILSLNEISKFSGLTELSMTSCVLNTGALADLPIGLTSLTWYNLSGLTVTGALADLPTGLTYLYWNNLPGLTVTGALADLPTGLTDMTWYKMSGLTVTGALADLPTDLTDMYWNNLPGLTVTGALADLPIGLTSLTWYNLSGLTVTGTIDQFPSTITSTLHVRSCVNTNIGYIGGAVPPWSAVTITFQNAWTATEVDDFLINWATTAGYGVKMVDLRGDNAARTSASDAAVTTLTGLGKTILTN